MAAMSNARCPSLEEAAFRPREHTVHTSSFLSLGLDVSLSLSLNTTFTCKPLHETKKIQNGVCLSFFKMAAYNTTAFRSLWTWSRQDETQDNAATVRW